MYICMCIDATKSAVNQKKNNYIVVYRLRLLCGGIIIAGCISTCEGAHVGLP
ncbi:hypothetical protein BDZ91DRAFT_410832 [Kalaharituber pfeilii]|nr:hypothetical protein BDZ91DRAFT_410832 [Kalaharituber pfeilii]